MSVCLRFAEAIGFSVVPHSCSYGFLRLSLLRLCLMYTSVYMYFSSDAPLDYRQGPSCMGFMYCNESVVILVMISLISNDYGFVFIFS